MAHRVPAFQEMLNHTKQTCTGVSLGYHCTKLAGQIEILLSLQGETISSPALAAPGLMLLVGGLVTIAFNGQAAASRRQQEADDGELPLQIHSI